MNERLDHSLRETAWRRPLTPDEEARLHARLAAQPQAQADWEQELALTEHLRQLPDAPLSSNFTAQVLRQLDADLAREARLAAASAGWLPWLRRFTPKLAPAGLLLVVSTIGYFQYQSHQHARVARDVAFVSTLVDVPGPEILQDFDAIRQLPRITDDDLLAALQ